MKLTWLGHACFLLEQEDFRIVIDPYTGVEGYPELRTSAHAVYCSHQHHDHNAVDQVTLLPKRSSPFTIREVPAFHDDQGGALRGENMIRVFTAGSVSVAHLGDLGHPLSPAQQEAIGPVDGVLIPVGGFYTIDAGGAKAVCEMLHPRWVVPMHYRNAPYGYSNIAGVEDFLAMWPSEDVHRLEGSSLDLDQLGSGVWVPEFS